MYKYEKLINDTYESFIISQKQLCNVINDWCVNDPDVRELVELLLDNEPYDFSSETFLIKTELQHLLYAINYPITRSSVYKFDTFYLLKIFIENYIYGDSYFTLEEEYNHPYKKLYIVSDSDICDGSSIIPPDDDSPEQRCKKLIEAAKFNARSGQEWIAILKMESAKNNLKSS